MLQFSRPLVRRLFLLLFALSVVTPVAGGERAAPANKKMGQPKAVTEEARPTPAVGEIVKVGSKPATFLGKESAVENCWLHHAEVTLDSADGEYARVNVVSNQAEWKSSTNLPKPCKTGIMVVMGLAGLQDSYENQLRATKSAQDEQAREQAKNKSTLDLLLKK